MTIIYYNRYLGRDDNDDPIYVEDSYDDGENDTTGLDEGPIIPGSLESVSGDFWGAAPGKDSSTVVDATTGNITYKYEDGSTMTVDRSGMPVGNTESPDAKGNSAAYNRALTWTTKTFGPTAGKVFSNMMANPGASLITALAAAKAFSGSDKEGGYNVPIPKLDMVQQQIQYNDPNRRPGSAGRQYFTDPRYVKEGDAPSIEGAQGAAATQAAGILAAYKPAATPAANPYIGKMKRDYNPAPVTAKTGTTTTAPVTPVTPPATNAGLASLPVMPTKEQLMDPDYKIPVTTGGVAMASGGIAAAKGRYLRGQTDGMADQIPSSIDGGQEAALSHGEFVIPADVVSHLGNGNSDAGADKLYQMMDRIRQARTGTKQQGKKINPDKFMPGGAIKGMAGGGKTSSETESEWAARQPDTSKIVDSMERKNALESWQKSRPGYVDPMDYKTYEDYAGAADISLGRDEGNDLTNRANFYGLTIENYQNALKNGVGSEGNLTGSELLSPLERIAAETARAQGLGTMSPEVAALAKANPEVFNAAAQKWQRHMSNTYPGTLEYQSVLSGPARYSSEGVKNPELMDNVNMYILDPRTGQIIKNPNYKKKTSGGLAAYMAGGSVRGYDTGGTVTPPAGIPLDTSKTSTLSPWAGDYVTNMLGKTQALANAPMQTYGGPLTAGASNLQQQGFAGISETAAAGYQPGSFTNQFTAPGAYKPTTSSFDTAAANQYMNPYLQASLNPQLEEARRQSQITQQQNAAKMTSAGAFGGSRGAIMDTETQRSLGANMANIVGTGYNTAYDKAMAQFNADQARKMAENQFGASQGMTSAQNTAQYGQSAQAANEASRQYSADFGLKSLQDLMRAGETERGIEAEGITADKRQFDEQQARPYSNLEFQRKMLEGLPIGASNTTVNQDALSKIQSDVSGLASLYKTLANLGIKP